ncbi:DUF6177 family protein [Kribbella sp. NPDC004875]|uniref:DUF6177 family protein n=1 Tax=Kribbella sp. NPDC004875 TaxID=3364107 RepID=UPI00368302D1
MPNELIFSPGVDLITDRVAVVMQDRPVIGMSAWLSDALTSARVENRDVQLVTPKHSRLTWPVRSGLFRGALSRWVVTGDDGEYYDGLNGIRLRWNGDQFLAAAPAVPDQPTSDMHPDYVVEEELFGHLQFTVRVRHKPVDNLLLGEVADRLFTKTTGSGPAGWSTSEPVTQPWSREALTEYCRDRAPSPTWLVVSGQPGAEFAPAVGTLEVRRVKSGVDETLTLSVAQSGMEFPNLNLVGEWIDDIADHLELVSAMVVGAFGEADGTYRPRFVGMSCPIGMAAGNEAVQANTLDKMLSLKGGERALAIGPAHTPAIWYPIGDGRNPRDWDIYTELMKSLIPADAASVAKR